MKKITDSSEKTSRRQFNKRVVTALVAAPVLTALSSCKQQEPTQRTLTTQETTPTPSPSPSPSATPKIILPGNPPIIIDDGSFMINLGARFKHQDMGGSKRRFKHTQDDEFRFYGAITHVRLLNDFGDKVCPDFPVNAGDTLELKMWTQIAENINDDDDGDGTVTYSALGELNDPDFILTNGDNGSFEFRYGGEESDKFKNPKVHVKKKIRHWRYEVKEKGNKAFRVGRVQITVNANTCTAGGEADPNNKAEEGFRIIILAAPATPPTPTTPAAKSRG